MVGCSLNTTPIVQSALESASLLLHDKLIPGQTSLEAIEDSDKPVTQWPLE